MAIKYKIIYYNYFGDNMKVKLFDESHEKDLETDINNFLKENPVEVIDIKFSVAVSLFSEEQIYCFSALIMYKVKNIDN